MLTMRRSDEDLCKFADQRRDMERLAGRWKKAELLREASEADLEKLKGSLRCVVSFRNFRLGLTLVAYRQKEDELVRLRNAAVVPPPLIPTAPAPTDAELMRKELKRLRARVEVLEEENAELRESS